MAAQAGANKGVFNRLGGFFRGVRSEIKKVSWPNKKDLINHTIVVLVTCALMGLLIWVLDTVYQGLLSVIVG
ncbi:preprotein translocase subunit SecE [Clostridiisalibacter paucivorans]|uniref:preprotein translocase subunit SecE n=1 Tax=Clostridiisalibacter paucivorans TaxID=408753 RepID=UPI000479AA81|nr:preprotein translocase subunit SecE [Clostridiisalibacter paucivorans]